MASKLESKAESYFRSYFMDAMIAARGNVRDAVRLLAVGAFESDAGRNRHQLDHNNHHGVTAGSQWTGPTFKVGSLVFREYPTDLAAFKDWLAFMKEKFPKVIYSTTDTDFTENMGNAVAYHGANPDVYTAGVRQYLDYFKKMADTYLLTVGGAAIGIIILVGVLSTFD